MLQGFDDHMSNDSINWDDPSPPPAAAPPVVAPPEAEPPPVGAMVYLRCRVAGHDKDHDGAKIVLVHTVDKVGAPFGEPETRWSYYVPVAELVSATEVASETKYGSWRRS
jgi:hypothetical protein